MDAWTAHRISLGKKNLLLKDISDRLVVQHVNLHGITQVGIVINKHPLLLP